MEGLPSQLECAYLTHWHANFILFSKLNLLNFDISHAFLPPTGAKLSTLKNSPVFWPTLYYEMQTSDAKHYLTIKLTPINAGFTCLFTFVCLQRRPSKEQQSTKVSVFLFKEGLSKSALPLSGTSAIRSVSDASVRSCIFNVRDKLSDS